MTEPDERQLEMIREVAPEDLEQLLDLEHETFADPYSPSLLRGLALSLGRSFLVAESGGRIVGYSVGLMEDSRSGHVMSIAVAADHRRGGIGSRLMAAVIEDLQTMGARRVFLEVRESNLAAQDFYIKLGFTQAGRIRSYYGDGEDALQYQLEIWNQ